MLSSPEKKSIIVSGAGSVTGFEIIKALVGSGVNYQVIGTDLDPDVPAKFLADLLQSPHVTDKSFIDFLNNLFQKIEHQYYFPVLIDEILFLSKNKGSLSEEVLPKILTPAEEWVALMESKLALSQFCGDNNIKGPRVLELENDFKGKVIAKQRRFFQERALRKEPVVLDDLSSPRQLNLGDEWYFSEYIAGDEFVVHGLSGFQNRFSECVFARRIKLRNGHDAIIEVIEPDDTLRKAAEHVMDILIRKPVGPVDMQFIRNEQGDYYLIDLDFNFPSALPVFVASGFNSPEILFNDLLPGKTPHYQIKPQRMYRHHAAFFENTGI